MFCATRFELLYSKFQFPPFLIWKSNFAKNFTNFGGCDLKFAVAGCESRSAKMIACVHAPHAAGAHNQVQHKASSSREPTWLRCARVPTPSSELACPRYTTLPPQSAPSRADVPQTLAVGFQDVVTSNRLQYRYGLKSQLSVSRFIRVNTRLDVKHAPSQCSTAKSASSLPYVRACCRGASTAAVPQAKHSTAQRNQPCTK